MILLNAIPLLSTAFSVALLIVSALVPFFSLRKGHGSSGGTGFLSSGALSLANCFSSGVFLGTCFLSLLPHTQMSEAAVHKLLFPADNYHQHDSTSMGAMLLNTNVMVLMGFLLIIVLEESVFLCISPTPESNDHHPLDYETGTLPSSSTRRQYRQVPRNRVVNKTKTPASSGKLMLNRGHHSEHRDGAAVARGNGSQLGEACEPLVLKSLESTTSEDDDSAKELASEDDAEIQFRPANWQNTHENHGHHSHVVPHHGSVAQSAVLLLAMSSHSIFEGVALGAQQNNGDFLRLLLSIMLHEALCSLAYGVSMVKQQTPTRFAVISSIFLSLSIPIGMLLMLVIGSFENTTAVVIKFIMEGLSAGIFIYVACVEMLADEFHHSHQPHSEGHDGGKSPPGPSSRCASLAVGILLAFILRVFS